MVWGTGMGRSRWTAASSHEARAHAASPLPEQNLGTTLVNSKRAGTDTLPLPLPRAGVAQHCKVGERIRKRRNKNGRVVG